MSKLAVSYDPALSPDKLEYERISINKSYICSYICTLILASFQQGYSISELNSVLPNLIRVLNINGPHKDITLLMLTNVMPIGAIIGAFFVCFIVYYLPDQIRPEKNNNGQQHHIYVQHRPGGGRPAAYTICRKVPQGNHSGSVLLHYPNAQYACYAVREIAPIEIYGQKSTLHQLAVSH